MPKKRKTKTMADSAPGAKIVSLSHILKDRAVLTIECNGGTRISVSLSRQQLRLLRMMSEEAIKTSELPEEQRLLVAVTDLFVQPPCDVSESS